MAADEVTQEVFLRAWKAFDRFCAGTNCRAWLYQILTYTVLHYQRREQRFPRAPKGMLDSLEAPLQIDETLTDRRLLALLDQLPGPYLSVLRFVDIDGFSYRETADALQIPVGTVMSRLSRARRQMRTLLLAETNEKPHPHQASGHRLFEVRQ